MPGNDPLERFIKAQEFDYEIALNEIRQGRKRSHWMWYIFPQISGLGFSETSKYYAISSVNEAKAFLQHPVLGGRLIGICRELIKLNTSNANAVFGSPDDMKLRSSMTLFSMLPGADPVFEAVLKKYFNSAKDPMTLQIINRQ